MRASLPLAVSLALGASACADGAAGLAPRATTQGLAGGAEHERAPTDAPRRLARELPRPARNGPPTAPVPGSRVDEARDDDPPPSAPPHGFSWIDDDVGGMAWPGTGADLAASLDWLAAADVGLVVTLTEAPLDQAQLALRGLGGLHLPIPDFTAPSLEQIDAFVAAAAAAIADDAKVAVHCLGGRGRTGTMLAAWLIAQGETADGAIARVRALRPGSIETAAQVDVLHRYAER